MSIHLPTLFLVTLLVAVVGGAMLLFSWLQNRSMVALGLWGSGFIVGAAGGALLAAREVAPAFWSIEIGNAVVAMAYGLAWSGARSFEGRRPLVHVALAGAVIWLLACQVETFYGSLQARITLASATSATYTILTLAELWYARDKGLMSRWPAIVLLLIHACFFLAREALAGLLPFPAGAQLTQTGLYPLGLFLVLVNNFCLAFLVVNMAKERVELEHRRAASIDPLTGVSNRRAFLERGERLIRRCAASGRTTALLLFDLDHFKLINDNFGHQTGDRVLAAFCDVAGAALRAGDLFGRLGGEEFACLLPDTSLGDALQAAERIRATFETRPMGLHGAGAAATVSIGVATQGDGEQNFQTLFAAADRALYRAKAKGRNRVEPARASLAPLDAACAEAG
jgi:diguanylate cyclase (GGDEF)-like protein